VKRLIGSGLAAVIVAIVAVVVLGSGASGATGVAASAASPVNRTFSYIAKPSSSTKTLFNLDSLLVNARCDPRGNPVVFAFTSAGSADIFGRMFDGFGRGHIIKNSAFTRGSKGVSLSPNVAGDFNSSGTVMYERSSGQVVTVNYAFDNATTLNKQNVCTVYGSVTAT
jgi:hypothetical protein